MKLLLIFALAVALHAEDAKPVPLATAEELTKQVAEQKQENERLLKLLNDSQRDIFLYRSNFNACMDQQQRTQQQAQRRPLATPEQPRSPALPKP